MRAIPNEGDLAGMASNTAVLTGSTSNHNGKRRGSNPKTELPDDFDFAKPVIKDGGCRAYG